MTTMGSTSSFRVLAATVIVFSLAMAYLESAVVVYLQGALGGVVGEIFPLRPASEVGDPLAIEVGREAATLVIIATVGMIAGRTPLERFAWSAVVFGAWDIGYYAWLWVFAGWPPSLATTDLLFLIPVPWVGPVWSPVAVSVALVGVGLLAARRLRAGGRLGLRWWHWAAGVGGGVLVYLSYTIDSGRVMDGGLPGPYPVPLFALGMLLALAAAAHAMTRGASPVSRSPGPGG